MLVLPPTLKPWMAPSAMLASVRLAGTMERAAPAPPAMLRPSATSALSLALPMALAAILAVPMPRSLTRSTPATTSSVALSGVKGRGTRMLPMSGAPGDGRHDDDASAGGGGLLDVHLVEAEAVAGDAAVEDADGAAGVLDAAHRVVGLGGAARHGDVGEAADLHVEVPEDDLGGEVTGQAQEVGERHVGVAEVGVLGPAFGGAHGEDGGARCEDGPPRRGRGRGSRRAA